MENRNDPNYKGFYDEEIHERKLEASAYCEKYGFVGTLYGRAHTELKYIYTIEAQQQEIDRLTYENRQLKAAMSEIFNSEPVDYHNPADTERINKLEQDYKDACKGRMIFFEEGISKNERIAALVSDKDQQAGTIMLMEEGLKQANQALGELLSYVRKGEYIMDETLELYFPIMKSGEVERWRKTKANLSALLGGAE